MRERKDVIIESRKKTASINKRLLKTDSETPVAMNNDWEVRARVRDRWT